MLQDVQQPDDSAIDTGDTAFMILATTFVFIQTPAMGIAQAGLLRKKNVLSMITQTMVGVSCGSLLYALVGFSMLWGESIHGLIGRPTHYPMLFNVSLTKPFPYGNATSIPAMTWCAFQMMFALMTPVIVTGAWAEKFSLIGFITFVIVWPLLVYYPLAHWLWHPDGWMMKLGVQDFAGGMVIHVSAGVSGLVVSGMLRQRRYMETSSKEQHNLPLFATGSFFIWAGWYFFNGGSAAAAGLQAATAMMNTHLAACAGSFVWMILSYWENKKFALGYFVNGALSGLGGITAASGYTTPQGAMCIGACASYGAYLSMGWVQKSKTFDDVLDCFALQGAPGMVGSTLLGVFGCSTVAGKDGLVYGGDGTLLGLQLMAVAVTTCYAAVWTYILIFAMQYFLKEKIEVSDVDDAVGLDLCQIGETGYDGSLFDEQDKMLLADKLCEAIEKGDFKTFMWLKETIYDTMPDISMGQRNRAGRNAFHVIASCHAGLFWTEDDALHGQLLAQFNTFDVKSEACAKWLAENSEAAKVVLVLLDYKLCINTADNFKRTPLQYTMDVQQNNSWQEAKRSRRAHEHELAAFASFLRFKGALTNPDAAISALNTAALHDDLDRLKVLLQWPGVVDLVDYDSRSALHVACEEWIDCLKTGAVSQSKKCTVQFLLFKKAHREQVDRWGLLPREMVEQRISELKSEITDLEVSGDDARAKLSEVESLEELQLMLATDSAELDSPEFYMQSSRKECPHCRQSVDRRISGQVTVTDLGDDEGINSEVAPILRDEHVLAVQLPKSVCDQALSYASSSMGLKPLMRLGLSTYQYATIKDDSGFTLLHVACLHGRLDIVTWLVGSGGVNLQATGLLATTDNYGHSPLFTAITACHLQDTIARVLRQAYRESHNDEDWPADPNLGFLLCSAAKENDKPFLNALRVSGCMLHDADYDGRTALHLAVCEQHVDLVDWLIANDTKHMQLLARDRRGNTPIDDALIMKKYFMRKVRNREVHTKEDGKKARVIYSRLRAACLMVPSAGPKRLVGFDTVITACDDAASLKERFEDHPYRGQHAAIPSTVGSFCGNQDQNLLQLTTDELETLVQSLVRAELRKYGKSGGLASGRSTPATVCMSE